MRCEEWLNQLECDVSLFRGSVTSRNLPAGGTSEKGRRPPRFWTGWIGAPAPFVCGTVVPAIAASNPHM
jgi:hypothetical protein